MVLVIDFFATYVCAFFSTTYYHFSMWKITKNYIVVLPFFLKHLRFMNKSNIYQTRSLKVPFIVAIYQTLSFVCFLPFESFGYEWNRKTNNIS